MAELWDLAKSFFTYAAEVGGVPFALSMCLNAYFGWRLHRSEQRERTLTDRLVQDGRDATDKLLEMSADKLLNESSMSQALSDLARGLNTTIVVPGPRKR